MKKGYKKVTGNDLKQLRFDAYTLLENQPAKKIVTAQSMILYLLDKGYAIGKKNITSLLTIIPDIYFEDSRRKDPQVFLYDDHRFITQEASDEEMEYMMKYYYEPYPKLNEKRKCW